MDGEDITNPNLDELLKSPAAVSEMGRQAREQAELMVKADRRKIHAVEFASKLVGGTLEKPFGLPVPAEEVVSVLLSLPEQQANWLEKVLTMTLKAAIDFSEHGTSLNLTGDGYGKPTLAEWAKPYLRKWLEAGKPIAEFFKENEAELGAMAEYNLAEFVKKE